MKKLISIVKRLTSKSGAGSIFYSKSTGEPCAHCGEIMDSSNNAISTGNGDKMHADCWGSYFEDRFSKIYKERLDKSTDENKGA